MLLMRQFPVTYGDQPFFNATVVPEGTPCGHSPPLPAYDMFHQSLNAYCRFALSIIKLGNASSFISVT